MGDGPGLREQIQIARRRLPLVGVVLLGVLGTVAIGTALQKPIYRAGAKVLIEPDRPHVVSFQEAGQDEPGAAQAFLQTEAEIVRSRPVVQQVMASLDVLSRKPELASERDPMRAFVKGVTIEIVRNTRILEIRVEDTDPKLAAEIADSLASTYAQRNLDLKLAAANEAFDWLTGRVADLKQKVGDSNTALQRHREEAGIVETGEGESPSKKKLMELESAYVAAKNARLAAESQLAELRRAARSPGRVEASPLVLNSQVVQDLKGQLALSEVELSRLRGLYRRENTEILQAQSQVDAIRQRIQEEMRAIVRSTEAELSRLAATERAMLRDVERYRGEAQDLSFKQLEDATLRREAESNQQIYDEILKRLKETALTRELEANNVRIIEHAETPLVPVRPIKAVNLALGALVGLVLGLIAAAFAEYADDTIRSMGRVERSLGIPVLGRIPVMPPPARSEERS